MTPMSRSFAIHPLAEIKKKYSKVEQSSMVADMLTLTSDVEKVQREVKRMRNMHMANLDDAESLPSKKQKK